MEDTHNDMSIGSLYNIDSNSLLLIICKTDSSILLALTIDDKPVRSFSEKQLLHNEHSFRQELIFSSGL